MRPMKPPTMPRTFRATSGLVPMVVLLLLMLTAFVSAAASVALPSSKGVNKLMDLITKYKDASIFQKRFTAALESLNAVDLNVIATENKAVWDRKSPLQYAVELGKLDVVNALLVKGANVGLKLVDGQTVLVQAVTSPKPIADGILDALIARNTESADSAAVLQGLVEGGSAATDSLVKLLTLGIDPNTLDKSGSTPFETAVKRGNVVAVTVLLSDKAVVPVTEASRLKALAHAVQSTDLSAPAMIETLLKRGGIPRPLPPGSPDILILAVLSAKSRDLPALILSAGATPSEGAWDALRRRIAQRPIDTISTSILLDIQHDLVTNVVQQALTTNPAATVADINVLLAKEKATVILDSYKVATDFGGREEVQGLRNPDGTLTPKGRKALNGESGKRVIRVNNLETFYYETNPVTAEEEARRTITSPAGDIIERLSQAYAVLPPAQIALAASDWANKLPPLLDKVLTIQDKAKFSISYTPRASAEFTQDWAKKSGPASTFYKDVPLTVNLGLQGSPKLPPGTANLAVDMFKMEKGEAATFSRHAKNKVESKRTQGNLELRVKPNKENLPPLRFNFHVDTVPLAQAANIPEFRSLKTVVAKDKSTLPLGDLLRDMTNMPIKTSRLAPMCIRKRDLDLAAHTLDPARIDDVLHESATQVLSMPLRRDLCDQDHDQCANAIFGKMRTYAAGAAARNSAFVWQKMAAAFRGSADAKASILRAIMNDVQRAFYYERKDTIVDVPALIMPALTDFMRVY